MAKVKIISDSTCDLSPALLERYDIDIIPLGITMGDKTYRDIVEIGQKEIFEWSEANKAVPKTSACIYEDAYHIVHPYVEQGRDIVYTGIGSSLSAAYQVMNMIAEQEGDRVDIRLVDSQNLSTGIGLLVLEAADMAEQGCSAAEIQERLNALVPKVRASFVVDTPRYLQRGGRCSAIAAFCAEKLKLRPMIAVKDGVLIPTKKYRGKMPRVLRHYREDLEPQMRNAMPKRVFVTHTVQEPETVADVVEAVKKLGIFEEVLETKAGGVISSHCGPGTLGILFIEK